MTTAPRESGIDLVIKQRKSNAFLSQKGTHHTSSSHSTARVCGMRLRGTWVSRGNSPGVCRYLCVRHHPKHLPGIVWSELHSRHWRQGSCPTWALVHWPVCRVLVILACYSYRTRDASEEGVSALLPEGGLSAMCSVFTTALVAGWLLLFQVPCFHLLWLLTLFLTFTGASCCHLISSPLTSLDPCTEFAGSWCPLLLQLQILVHSTCSLISQYQWALSDKDVQ